MTGEALRAAWNEYGLSRGSLVLLWSKNEVVVLNGHAHVTAQGQAVIELLRLGRWPLDDLVPIFGKDLRYLETFVPCDRCGVQPKERCVGGGSRRGARVHPQRQTRLLSLIERRMEALLAKADAGRPDATC